MKARFSHWRLEPLKITEFCQALEQSGLIQNVYRSWPKYVAVTRCVIENDERQELARGYAICRRPDQFNKKRGRQIAHGRAIKFLKESF